MSRKTLFATFFLLSQVLFGLDASFFADSLHGSLGDVITFSWDLQHNPDGEVIVSEPQLNGTGIEIIDQQIIRTKSGSELHIKTAVYDSVGIFHFPELFVYIKGALGADSLILQGPDLNIISILTAADTTFRDIKGLHRINTPMGLMIVLWILALSTIAYLAYYLYKRFYEPHKNGTQPSIITPPEDAHIIALRELEILKQSRYLHNKKYKQFYSDLSFILKQYYENRYLLDALELTSKELMRKMNRMEDFDPKIISTTQSLLEIADFIKFAKGSSTTKESNEKLDHVFAIVNTTKIQSAISTPVE